MSARPVSDMMFLLRATFWLGMTFSAMDVSGDIALPTTGELAAGAKTQATRLCVENPRACLETVKAVQDAGKSPVAAPDVGKAGADTLRREDRMPGWRGRS